MLGRGDACSFHNATGAMADDPFLEDPIDELPKDDIASGLQGAVRAQLHEVVPRLNALIRRQKKLHERLLALEERVLDGSARAAEDNPLLVLEPLTEALSDGVREKLVASDLDIESALDVAEADDAALLSIDGIGEATLEDIREQYPALD